LVKQWDDYTYTATTVGTTGTFNIQLQDFANSAQLLNLYDMYRIKSAKVTFIPKAGVSNFTSTVSNINEMLHTALDYDSPPNATFGRAQLQQFRSYKSTTVTRKHTRRYRPAWVQATAYLNSSGVATTTYKKGTGWVDMANPDVPHCPLRYAIDRLADGPTDAVLYFNVIVECIVDFKNVY